MAELITAAENEALLEDVDDKVVALGADTARGIVHWAPVTVLEGRGGPGGVITGDAMVTIARGSLPGITAELGTGLAISVPDKEGNVVACEIISVGVPDSEPDGDFLELILQRA